MNLIQLLKRCEVFVGLDDTDLQKIASLPSWQMTIFNAGDFLFLEGDVSNDFYILEGGELSLLATSRKEGAKDVVQVPVDTITKGDVFGWSSLVAPHSRNLSAICIKRSTVASVSGRELSELMDSNHTLGYEVMKSLVRVIASRLRDVQGKLVGNKKSALQKAIRTE